MVSPVIHPDSSEARNTTAGAISPGWPTRPSGVSAFIREGLRVRAKGQIVTSALSKDYGIGIMARPLRILYPNAFYHVTCRGNDQYLSQDLTLVPA